MAEKCYDPRDIDDESAFIFINLPSEEIARKIVDRGVTVQCALLPQIRAMTRPAEQCMSAGLAAAPSKSL